MLRAKYVWEWCVNEYDHPEKVGLTGGMNVRRVVRGGSWDGDQLSARAPYRARAHAGNRSLESGLRVVCAAPIC